MGEAAVSFQQFEALPETWITTEIAASLLGISDRTLRRSMESYQVRQVPKVGRGGDRYEVRLSSLPADAIDAWQSRQKLDAAREHDAGGEIFQAYQRADQKTRRHFDRWAQVLAATKDLDGRKALASWCEIWNANNPDNQISLGSLYRVRAQVAEHGMVGLLLKETRLPESSVRDDWFKAFCDAYLCENKISSTDAHLAALGCAMRLGHDTSAFPSARSFMRRLEREFSPALISLKRDGEKKFYDRHGYYAERDYSSLVSGRIWVGDSRVLDVLVQDGDSPSPVRPWITCFICMKSYVPMGWYIHTSAPSSENTMRALRHGIVRVGKPEWLYLDNGREYRNNEVTGMSRGHRVDYDKQHTGSLCAQLEIQVHFAEVHNARAKPIERQFLEMKNHFDRFQITFKGGTVVEKPNRLKQILQRQSQIPAFEAVRDDLDFWLREVHTQRKCNGKTHKGRTRAQVLQADYAIHGPLSAVSADTAAMLVSKMARGRIDRRGFTLSPHGLTWWAEWMVLHKGRSVVLRYDPDDLRLAWCYEATETGHGSLIGTCDLVASMSAMISADDPFGLAQSREATTTRKRELKVFRSIMPQATASDLDRIREDYARGVGAAALDLPQSSLVSLTPHDQTAAAVRREQRSGRTDLTAFVQPIPKPARELVWFEGQTAAG